MRVNTILMTLVLVLSGCATAPEAIRVEKLPEPPVIVRPELALSKITSTSTTDEVIQAYYEAVVKLQAALDEAIAALDAYRSK
jgi:starvation-inducible outer membrane lipoprotein